MATKAEKERTARNDKVLRGTPSGHNPPSLERTPDEIAADNDKVLRGQSKAGNVPDNSPRAPEV